MTRHADSRFAAAEPPPPPPPPPLPLPVQPLGYAPPVSEGWETPLRLTLCASGIYHAINSATSLAQARWYYGFISGPARSTASALVQFAGLSEVMFVIATGVAAVASFMALRRRSHRTRMTILWGAGIAAGCRAVLPLVSFATVLVRSSTSPGYRVNAGTVSYIRYAVQSALNPFAALVLPALIIVMLTRGGARRAFGEQA